MSQELIGFYISQQLMTGATRKIQIKKDDIRVIFGGAFGKSLYVFLGTGAGVYDIDGCIEGAFLDAALEHENIRRIIFHQQDLDRVLRTGRTLFRLAHQVTDSSAQGISNFFQTLDADIF